MGIWEAPFRGAGAARFGAEETALFAAAGFALAGLGGVGTACTGLAPSEARAGDRSAPVRAFSVAGVAGDGSTALECGACIGGG